MLEPLTDVPLVQAGCGRELGGGQRASVGHDQVQPEPIAQVDGEEVEGADRVGEQQFDQRIASRGGFSPQRALDHLAAVLIELVGVLT